MANNSNKGYIKFWGVRGSNPTPDKDKMYYGGDTSCFEVRTKEMKPLRLPQEFVNNKKSEKNLRELFFKTVPSVSSRAVHRLTNAFLGPAIPPSLC